jgi:hypothetical protein
MKNNEIKFEDKEEWNEFWIWVGMKLSLKISRNIFKEEIKNNIN